MQIRPALRVINDHECWFVRGQQLPELYSAGPVDEKSRSPAAVAQALRPFDEQPGLANSAGAIEEPHTHRSLVVAPGLEFLDFRLADLLKERNDLIPRAKQRSRIGNVGWSFLDVVLQNGGTYLGRQPGDLRLRFFDMLPKFEFLGGIRLFRRLKLEKGQLLQKSRKRVASHKRPLERD